MNLASWARCPAAAPGEAVQRWRAGLHSGGETSRRVSDPTAGAGRGGAPTVPAVRVAGSPRRRGKESELVTRRIFLVAMAALSGLVAVLVRQPETFTMWGCFNIALCGAWRLR